MNSYEETVIESCWNVIELWNMEASDEDIDKSITRLKQLITRGPEGFEKESNDYHSQMSVYRENQ